MKKLLVLFTLLLLVLSCSYVFATPLQNHNGSNSIVSTPYGPVANPGATSSIWSNPAGIGNDQSSGLLFFKPGTSFNSDYFANQHGLGINLGHVAFGWESNSDGPVTQSRYTLASSSKIVEGFYIGLAYHWSKNMARQNSYDVGLLVRPTRWISLGAKVENAFRTGHINGQLVAPNYNFGLALRPMGNRLTITAEASLHKTSWENDFESEMDPTIGASWLASPGIAVHGGYALDSEVFTAGLSFNFGSTELKSSNHSKSSAYPGLDDIKDIGVSSIRLSSGWKPSFVDKIKKKRVVIMRFNDTMVEEVSSKKFGIFGIDQRTILETVKRLDVLTKDDNISGIWLQSKGFSQGLSDFSELRDALVRFKKAGKKIVVSNHEYAMRGYYLASIADEVILNPAGDISLKGIGFQLQYYKRLLEKLHIEAQFLTVGKYKSAGERFTREGVSDAARESYEALIEVLWQEWLGAVAEGRGVSKSQVSDWVDNALFTAPEAKELGLVDTLLYPDQIPEYILKSVFKETKSTFQSEWAYFGNPEISDEWEDMTSPKVAVVYAVGEIHKGKSSKGFFTGSQTMGDETVAKAIRQARANPRVKAIVLRVDSPGGSALASDYIAREVKRTVDKSIKNVRHIPVIVSMSDVAASGGYYISALADKIVAPKTCITGSIGVVGGKFVTGALMDTIGVDNSYVQRGKNVDIYGNTNRWNEEQAARIQKSMDHIYENFTDIVAEGREMDKTTVYELGQGRVWSGVDAKENGLIDEFGGLYEAIEIAKESAGINRSEVVDILSYPVCGYDPFSNMLSMKIFERLPDSVKELMRAQEELTQWDEGEVLMLTPLDREVISAE
jgi:protease IV